MEAVFESAAQVLEKERERLKMTKRNGDLDALIDGIELGRSYLFYDGQLESSVRARCDEPNG